MGAWIRRAGGVIVMGFMATGTACHSDSAVSPSSTPAVTVEAVTAVQVEGTVAQAVVPTPTVIVKDLLGKPVAGVTVNFSDPTGTVSVSGAVTDQSGTASPGQWIPSDRAGQSNLFIRIDGVVRIRFTAFLHPDIPAFLRALSDTDNVQLAGTSITGIAAVVQDKWGNGIPGVGIAFSLSGPGTLSQPSTVTVDNGWAGLTTWTPGPGPGSYGLVARVAGLDSVVFKTRALDPESLDWYELEAMIVNGKHFPTADEYVENANLALSSDGYYVEDIAWTYIAGTDHRGGRYKPSDSNGSIAFSKSGETAIIAGDSLLIGRRDLDDGFPVTWLYRLRTR